MSQLGATLDLVSYSHTPGERHQLPRGLGLRWACHYVVSRQARA